MDKQNFLGKISEFFIDRYRVTYLLIIAVILIGVTSYLDLPREQTPEVVMPYGMIMTTYTGVAPQEIESLVTDKIENAISDIDDIENITSTSSNGSSMVMLEFSTGVDMDSKVQELSTAISQIQNELPDECSTPMVRSFQSGDMPIMTLNVTGDYSLIDLKYIGEDIADSIENINGIDEVTVVGGLEREIQIIVDSSKLSMYGISLNEIQSAIDNANLNSPGGNIEMDKINYTVRTVAEFDKVDEIKNTIIKTLNNSPIYLRDIAQVKDTYADMTSYSQRYEPGISEKNKITKCLTLTITREDAADVVGLAEEIINTINNGKGILYPNDINVTVMNNEAENVEEALSNVLGNALSGLLLVIVVLFLIIGLRESLIVAFVIPFSLLSTFFLMKYTDNTLNTLSLVALIISLGMLVDNAIVIVENIDKTRNSGTDITTASKSGSSQVAPAVLAATLTTMAAFYPMSLLPGMMGNFLKTIPTVIMFAIGSSFVISIIVTPSLCSRFLGKYKHTKKQNGPKAKLFRKILSILVVFTLSIWAFIDDGKIGLLAWVVAGIFTILMIIKQFKADGVLDHENLSFLKLYGKTMSNLLKSRIKKISVIIIGILVLCASLYSFKLGLLKVSLLPTSDSTSVTVNISTPPGRILEHTSEIVTKVENLLFEREDVIKSFTSKVGNTGGRRSSGDDANTAEISVILVDEDQRDQTSMEIITDLKNAVKNIAGAEITVSQSSFGPRSGSDISIELTGDDLDELKTVANDFKEILRNIEGTTEVTTSIEGGSMEAQIIIDKEKSSMLGLSTSDISSEIRRVINGTTVSTFIDGQDEIDINLKVSSDKITTIGDLDKIYFQNTNGKSIAFSQVASIVETKGYSEIEHDNLDRILTVESSKDFSANTVEIISEFKEKTNDYKLPDGITVSYGGEYEQTRETFGDMAIIFVWAILIVFIILAIQFNSFSQPMVILFSVPLAIIGALFGLIITGNDFGLFAFMGIVALVGISVNDAIVLVDFTNYTRKQGHSITDSIVTAGKARFLPVFSTSITTIGGILPLALKQRDYAQMGFSLIFGLITSTVLTLVYIPTLYSFVEELKCSIRKKIPLFVERSEKGENIIEI